MRAAITFIITSLHVVLCHGQNGYFSSDNILKFAQYLESKADYSRAADEYQRYMFSTCNSILTDSFNFVIASCYEKDEQYVKATNFFNRVGQSSALYDSCAFRKAIVLAKQERYQESLESIDTFTLTRSESPLTNSMVVLRGINSIYLRNWQMAGDQIHYFDSINALNNTKVGTLASLGRMTNPMLQLTSIVNEHNKVRYKSPVLAGVMSALIPGSGKLYTKHTQDGIYSFLLVGISYWQAYVGYSENGIASVKGWIFMGLGTGFYVGNIYGSVVSAKIYNQQIDDKLVQQFGLSFKF